MIIQYMTYCFYISIIIDIYLDAFACNYSKVGSDGEKGVAQLVDLLITTEGPLPGAVLLEWNMGDPAGHPASSGLWEVGFTTFAIPSGLRCTN